ncbi:hypothetical protein Glove_750g29 [Diversispora epigaea]|uniref:Uncharacterized protein n=1 Tax=Diversispora epigaea TaxID=1348612 RepID=A0A397FZU6_9GLOM|nr:hypothetical protein Glove_750g29 [Diversispora epigaea]
MEEESHEIIQPQAETVGDSYYAPFFDRACWISLTYLIWWDLYNQCINSLAVILTIATGGLAIIIPPLGYLPFFYAIKVLRELFQNIQIPDLMPPSDTQSTTFIGNYINKFPNDGFTVLSLSIIVGPLCLRLMKKFFEWEAKVAIKVLTRQTNNQEQIERK